MWIEYAACDRWDWNIPVNVYSIVFRIFMDVTFWSILGTNEHENMLDWPPVSHTCQTFFIVLANFIIETVHTCCVCKHPLSSALSYSIQLSWPGEGSHGQTKTKLVLSVFLCSSQVIIIMAFSLMLRQINLNNLIPSLEVGVAQSVVCWACCPAWCRVTGLIISASGRGVFFSWS